MRGATVAGLDGCRGGWVLVRTSTTGGTIGSTAVQVVTDVSEVLADLESGRLAAATIDIPIGLPARTARGVDAEARRLIGPRRSSVFPAPLRCVLAAGTYNEACALSRAVCGKAISKQAFAILPKIRDVDRVMTPERQHAIAEMHPELSFTMLAGSPMQHHKSTPQGLAERASALGSVFPDLDDHLRRTPSGVQRDDVLDAFVGAWSAHRWLNGAHRQLGGEVDERGLRMEMIA